MRISRLSRNIQGYKIIDLTNGEVIGKVEDSVINLDKLQIEALVTSTGNPIFRKLEAVHRKNIEVWGEDVILVSGLKVIQDIGKLKENQNWETVTDEIQGKDIINTKGEKIAELNDVVIDSEGQVIGYDLSKVMIEGPIEETKRIHANTTQAIGKDALIIETDKLYRWEFKETK